MRIGAALDALDFVVSGMPKLERRQKLDAYATIQVIVERLRAIGRARGLSVSLINAQLLKIQFSVETLAGLGPTGASEELQLGDVRAALTALTSPDCFGLHLDTNE
ncbi:hypothetical protein [Labrys wisconsinensis]|uniref:Uncharacterized protein n=1 Tax=Labrys wisconsinensis TaxID=425677 RepID=A0ABU0IZA4_9HYPH|nr:hypothetical protein [Labrys wisconsinensis]MDQ0467349.1 hypothetical protein [Labrys wisconsinensis]